MSALTTKTAHPFGGAVEGSRGVTDAMAFPARVLMFGI